MTDNLSAERGVRVPRQVAAAAQAARDALSPPALPEADLPAADPQPPAGYTVEQLLSAPDQAKNASRDYWYARANVIEGFRRDDAARNAKRIKDLEEKLKLSGEKNAELARAHPAAPVVDVTKWLSEDQIEDIGEDRAAAIVGTILRAVAENNDAEVQRRIDAAVKPLLDRQQQHAEETAEQRYRRFVEELTDGFPTWEATDKDPRWLRWLGQIDDVTGHRRQDLIDLHKKNLNAPGIVRMLTAFVHSLKPAPVPPAPPMTPAALESGGEGGSAPADNSEDPNLRLTDAQVRAGFKRKSLGKMSPKEEKLFDARVEATMRAKGRA